MDSESVERPTKLSELGFIVPKIQEQTVNKRKSKQILK